MKLTEWLELPLNELRERCLSSERALPSGLLDALESDPRSGAQGLARTLRSRQAKNRSEGQRLRWLLRFEIELWDQGIERVAGVDEAGRGPLAGPVTAGAVILKRDYRLRGLDDSKKIFDPAVRVELAQQIKQDAVAWAVASSSVEEIDRLNIRGASLLAMRRAIEKLNVAPEHVLVDAERIPGCPHPQRGIIKGDSLSMSIAAASILAKTTRDAHMVELSLAHPGYGFHEHMGYPTPEHVAQLKKLGASPIHRRSFAPVRTVLGLDVPPAEQLSLYPARSNG